MEICFIYDGQDQPQCQQVVPIRGPNPIHIVVPASQTPFTIRLRASGFTGQSDIVFVDNIRYSGRICPDVSVDARCFECFPPCLCRRSPSPHFCFRSSSSFVSATTATTCH